MKVGNNYWVARTWAARTQPYGRSNNGNFSFDGARLYSYRTCIANILDRPEGPVYLFTNHRYSVTTSGKHIEPARHFAVGHEFVVPQFEPSYGGLLRPDQHAGNRLYLIGAYNAERATIRRRLSPRGEYTWAYLNRLHNDAKSYCLLFDLPPPGLNEVSDRAEIEDYHRERDAKRNSPAGIARREYGRIYRKWKGLVKERKNWAPRGMEYLDRDHCEDSRGDAEIGWMSWWAMYSKDADALALIKWRFRKEVTV